MALQKIALEEHVVFPEFVGYLASTKVNINPALFDRVVPVLSDFGEARLAKMDEGSIAFAVLSLAGPGVQIEPDTARAVKLAKHGNDLLAAQINRRPRRYGGFAHLPMQDAQAAADELERCMTALGFQGAMINGQTHGVYLDDRRYDVFWERAASLAAPIYIHPGNPVDMPAMYEGQPGLWGPVWSWAVETCTHALRLVLGGVFERYPGARIILGHMGETLPMQLWRLDSRLPISNFAGELSLPPSDYLRQNIYLTTSGVCADAPLRCAIDAFGLAHVLFSVDYPFENTATACRWIEQASISATERAAVAHGNAASLLGLALPALSGALA